MKGATMKRMFCVVAVLGLVSGVLSDRVVAQTKGKTDPVLSKLAKEWADAFNAKNAAKVAALYTEDATVNVPNEPAVQGRKNIQAWVQKTIDQGMSNLVLTPTESAMSGNIAYETGTYSMTIAPPGGKPATDKGKYVVVLKQAGGSWLLAHDIFNSDLPPPPASKPGQ
jgi:uncharacterized protein (TIGR02246 family)